MTVIDTSRSVSFSEANPSAKPVSEGSTVAGLRLADGKMLAAGLNWEKLTATSDLPMIGTARPRLKHGDRIARAGELDIPSGTGSLLLALGVRLIAEASDDLTEGLFLFVSDLSGSQHNTDCWTALAELRKHGSNWFCQPVPRSETIHADHGAAVDAINDLANTTDLAGICLCTVPSEHPDETIDAFPSELLTRDGMPRLWRVKPEPGDLPVFTAPIRVTPRAARITALACAGLIAVSFVPRLVADLLRAAPLPPPELISVAPAQGEFARACTTGLTSWWPRIAGWQTIGRGCAVPRHLPSDVEVRLEALEGGTMPVVIWQRLKRTQAANAVLAQNAATRVLDTWTAGKSISAEEILLWQAIAIPLIKVNPDEVTAPPADSRSRIAAIWAHLPDAVRDGAGDSVIIQTSDAPTEFLARATRVSGLEPVRLDLVGPSSDHAEAIAINSLYLAPVSPRLVPTTAPSNDQGASR